MTVTRAVADRSRVGRSGTSALAEILTMSFGKMCARTLLTEKGRFAWVKLSDTTAARLASLSEMVMSEELARGAFRGAGCGASQIKTRRVRAIPKIIPTTIHSARRIQTDAASSGKRVYSVVSDTRTLHMTADRGVVLTGHHLWPTHRDGNETQLVAKVPARRTEYSTLRAR